jgi:hypothetical protein
MDVKLKAKELVEKCYSKYNNVRKDKVYSQEQKRMANLIVDEMLIEYPSQCPKDSYEMERHLFWLNVKKEIKLL